MTVFLFFNNSVPDISKNHKYECVKLACCAKQIIACGSKCIKPCCEKA